MVSMKTLIVLVLLAVAFFVVRRALAGPSVSAAEPAARWKAGPPGWTEWPGRAEWAAAGARQR